MDPKEIFKGQKYIVHVEEKTTIKNEKIDMGVYLNQMEMAIRKKGDDSLSKMIQRLELFDQGQRLVQKTIFRSLLQSKDNLMELEKKVNAFQNENPQICDYEDMNQSQISQTPTLVDQSTKEAVARESLRRPSNRYIDLKEK